MIPAPMYLVIEGDSISLSFRWPSFLLKGLDDRMQSVVNMATAGEGLAEIVNEAATEIDPNYDSRKATNILSLWAGTNDLASGTTGSSCYTLLHDYCLARQAVGFKVIVFTTMPRANAGLIAGFEAERQIYNGLIQANWSTFADALVDVTTDSRLSDATDLTYFNSDGIHPTAAGDAVIWGLIKPQLMGLLPQ